MATPSHADGSGANGATLEFPSSGLCFGCSDANDAGLRLRFRRDGTGVATDTVLAERFQGAAGVAHGGIQAVLLDEVCCAAAFFTRGTYVVTGELAIRYRRPCPVAHPLRVRGEVTADHGRYFVVRAAIVDATTGDTLTTSEGKFFRDGRRTGA
jgi:uncharacterized protein (TIGR00369 family)